MSLHHYNRSSRSSRRVVWIGNPRCTRLHRSTLHPRSFAPSRGPQGEARSRTSRMLVRTPGVQIHKFGRFHLTKEEFRSPHQSPKIPHGKFSGLLWSSSHFQEGYACIVWTPWLSFLNLLPQVPTLHRSVCRSQLNPQLLKIVWSWLIFFQKRMLISFKMHLRKWFSWPYTVRHPS